MDKLLLENKNNVTTEYLNEINYLRSLDIEEALVKWFNDFLSSNSYNQLLKETNTINYSEYFLLSEDYKIIELIKLYQNLPTANQLVRIIYFLFGDGVGVVIERFRHKYLKIQITKDTSNVITNKNLITDANTNIIDDNDNNIVAGLRRLGLTDSNLVNLFFLIINFNTKIDLKVIENETITNYSNYEFNHNPL